MKLVEFCTRHGLTDEAAFYRKSLIALGYVGPATRPASQPRQEKSP